MSEESVVALAYLTATGEATKWITAGTPASIDLNLDPGEDWIDISYDPSITPEKTYVRLSDLSIQYKVDFPQLSWSDFDIQVNELITISQIPANTTVVWPDSITTVESGDLSFTIDMPGWYSFVFRKPQYFEKTEKFYVNP